ncbi:3-dehydroquinate synthase [Azospirillum sp. TSH100]|uniref:3-dehydroquinate synthase n=1 Tax=Azospirillum sp. TSH100 TaxID=652764 RepID=UPI000D6150D1|nr:3-dehydroquinate synthase [Azospirillum sp. TSH100]PWC88374.1 3-dehydroquinate synthase [Azospirillum sp. TSH100]QCG90577.1 3-dehydroquinate synthase [Azospirillum sp. TSH100]
MTSLLHPDAHSSIVRQHFTVTFDYAVAFTRGAFDPANATLAEAMGAAGADPRPRCVAFVDMGVLDGHPTLPADIAAHFAARDDLPNLVAPPRLLPGGEAVKNDPALIGQMHDAILGNSIDRHSYVLAVGGGAFLDAVGLAASTAHRGVRLVRIPTTVLAQNDSGVGVKNAINMNGAKNQIGTFSPPWAVVNDAAFLDSLPQRDRIAGMAEAVKVALIRDSTFFEWLERSADALTLFEPEAVAHLIRRCAELHMRQIAGGGDPFEQGSARPLDFGHWSAHKLETLSRNHLRHGEAVAIGIALDTRYSVLAGLLPEGEDVRVAVLLEHLGFRLWHTALARRDDAGRPLVLAGLEEFREHLGGRLTITLLAGIGLGVEVNDMDAALVESAIGWLSARETA